MNQDTGVFFPLDETEYQAVCEISNQRDVTLGQALSLLISKGRLAMEEEAEAESRYSIDKDYLNDSLTNIGATASWISQEIDYVKDWVKRARDEVSCLEKEQHQEEE